MLKPIRQPNNWTEIVVDFKKRSHPTFLPSDEVNDAVSSFYTDRWWHHTNPNDCHQFPGRIRQFPGRIQFFPVRIRYFLGESMKIFSSLGSVCVCQIFRKPTERFWPWFRRAKALQIGAYNCILFTVRSDQNIKALAKTHYVAWNLRYYGTASSRNR